LEHTYAQLPAVFHVTVAPTPVQAPRLVLLNRPLAISLGLSTEALMADEPAAVFAGNRLPPGAAPLAQAYAGHQFGNFTMLGDGRAILLGEQVTPTGERYDVQLKGSGPTRFSRRGDGRAALGPMLREYIISEAMHALRIPTTRSLAVTATGETVWRQPGPLPGAVLTRVAASHVRVGTFEWAAAQSEDPTALRALLDYTIRRHYPQLAGATLPAQALLEAAIERQAALIAQWQLVGFVHGVMNTDNMALSGETIDYGPCAFMDRYDPATVFSSIDVAGRYAYGNQPRIAQWNLTRLAESLLPLYPDEQAAIAMATEALQHFTDRFEHYWLSGTRRKLGLFNEEPGDRALVDALLDWMRTTHADHTNTFAALADSVVAPDAAAASDPAFTQWHDAWQARLARQPQPREASVQLQRAHNPAVIPRNHLVEAALAAAEQGDISVTECLLDVLAAPFDHERHAPKYRLPAPADGACYQTFCGT
jgi:uncharacterized protein YdiU (UPF0061 family)